MKKILTAVILMLAPASTFAVFAQGVPQDATQAQVEGQRPQRRAGGMRRRFMRRRAMRSLGQLNLSDAQREQMRSIRQSAFDGTKAKREELRQLFMNVRQGGQLTPEQEARAKQLRTELRESRARARKDVLGVLTPEQRTQLEQLKQERNARREEMRKRRGQWREQREQLREDKDQPPRQQ